MSHRFRDQSSSASITRPQPHPSPASAPRSSRFARPSLTQQPLSTPGTSISRFRDKPRLKDEIEISFGETDQSSPQWPSRSRFSPCVSQYQGGLDDLDDHEEGDLRIDTASQSGRRRLTAEVEDDDLADLEFLEKLRGTRASQYIGNHEIDSCSSEDADLITPFASRKRRRLNNRTDHDFNTLEDDNPIEHIPVDPSAGRETGAGSLETASSDADLPSSPLAASAHAPSMISSRFKIPPQTPSLTQTTPRQVNHKPSFRHLPEQHHAATPSSSTSLPIAFSPSRRRGGRGKDYLPGGAADTVRNWILGLGAMEEQGPRRGNGGRGVEKVRVAEVIGREAGGRCALIKDEAGSRRVLIGGEAGGLADGSTSHMGRKRIEAGKLLSVRMGWDVDLSLKDTHDQEEDDGGANKELCKVAVLWDVLDG